MLLTNSVNTAIEDWLLTVVLREVIGSIAVGIALGYAAGKILNWAESKNTIGQTSLSAFALALKLLGSDGILAVFITGLTFGFTFPEAKRERQERLEHIQETINRFFILPIFVLFGMIIPWQEWIDLGWTGLAIVAAVILFRRLPAMLIFRKFYLWDGSDQWGSPLYITPLSRRGLDFPERFGL